jgi:hypothetical protein
MDEREGEERDVADETGAGLRGTGPVWRRVYVPNAGKHGPEQRGRVGREPANGQDALDNSVRVRVTSRVRVGVDYDDDALVVLRWHVMGEFHDAMNYQIFHGYVVDWASLTQEFRNALLRARMVNLKGKIL